MKLSLILVNYNGKRFLEKVFSSIFDQTVPQNEYEVIMVDNSSKDDSVSFVKKNFPKVKVINNENNGFGCGCNLGASYAKGKYLLFMNIDTFVDRDFLEKFEQKIDSIELSKIRFGTAACKILSYDKKATRYSEEYGGGADFIAISTINYKKSKHMYNTGCVMLVNKENFIKVGGFCKNIFLYSEDLDLCWRYTIMGYEHLFFKDICIYHYDGGLVGNFNSTKLQYYLIGELNVIWNNYSSITLFFALITHFCFYLCLATIYAIFLKFNYTAAICNAYWKFYKKDLEEVKTFRKTVQKNRVLRDTVILRKIYFIPARIRNLFIKSLQ